MSRYNDYDSHEEFYTPNRTPSKKIPTHYEDISSDYLPEEKKRYTRRSNSDFSIKRQEIQSTGERKFFDDSFLNRKIDPDTAQRRQAELRQQELEERRRAREAQEAIKRQNIRNNDYYGATGVASYRNTDQGGYGAGSDYYSGNSAGYYTQQSNGQSTQYSTYRQRRDMDDTLEGIPLSSAYTDEVAPVRRRGSAGSGRPPGKGGNGGGRDEFDPNSRGRRPGKKKRHILRKVLIVVLVLVLAGGGAVYGAIRHALSGLNQTDISDIDKLGISNAINEKYGAQSVINFALFGIDTRDDESMEGLSDSIMIVSVNRKTGAVKLISILRDSYVPIEGHGKQKITHAYSYGGAELAINTINQNFDMNIQDYATVNFAKMADIIDTLGGIDLEISRFEWEYTNGIGQSTYGKKNYEDLEAPGQVHMNGKQAVSYARIREDSDANRAERQRKVLSLLVNKVKSTSVLKYPALIKELLGYVETSMSYDEIMGFVPIVTKNITLEQTAVPDEELDDPIGGSYNGNWVWRYDLNDAADRIHKFIYE